MNPTVFLNYAREDTDAARQLCSDLRSLKRDVWFDKDSLLGGQRWLSAITEAIKNSSYFITLLSSNSVGKRGIVQKEIKEALKIVENLPEDEIFIIPVRLDECEPSYRLLRDIHWIDLFPDWEAGVRQIVKATAPKMGNPDDGDYRLPYTVALLDQLLSARAKEKPKSIPIPLLLRDVIEMVQGYAMERRIKINVTNTAGGIFVKGKMSELRLVLFNILHNAIRYSYTFKGDNFAWVKVVARVENKFITIEVENWGVPIKANEIDHIFKIGYRGSQAMKAEGLGSGLGLYTVKRILESFGGNIKVVSLPGRLSIKGDDLDQPYITSVTLKLPIYELA